MPYDLAAPPEGNHPSADTAYDFATAFGLAYSYAIRKNRSNYTKRSKILKKITPGVFVTDCELVLKNALRKHYEHVSQLIYMWHIAKNVGIKI
ncbi:uncharacterized protein K452DRAFT_321533 [Aplosporella prunicola CBS 121167]|uniref:MULE transposase domain-containing protein n=1 Tax=Aplosporella prunicola CBS 121167 TaxID=1176127 RepID=A0A6A6B3S3_9PEZI|nr:uncharacterized protein K452DRAFT_321533 [Aplosporella prunicola CBS 121167]KAF2137854.1 hypothetical protein K452DRAFT_321533 [Aplosporella prunicola CBS 121167]